MATERNYFITMHHQAVIHFENFTEVKFRDILLTGTGHQDRRLNRDSPGQTGTYGRSTSTHNVNAQVCFTTNCIQTFNIFPAGVRIYEYF